MAVTKHVMKSDMTQDITRENDRLAYLAGMRILRTGSCQRTLWTALAINGKQMENDLADQARLVYRHTIPLEGIWCCPFTSNIGVYDLLFRSFMT